MSDENKNITPVSDPFLNSVDNIKAEDIISSSPETKRRLSVYELLRFFLIAVFLTVFIVSVCILADRVFDYGEADELYDHMADIWNSDEFVYQNPYGEVAYSDKDAMASCTPDFEAAQSLDGTFEGNIEQGSVESPEMVAVKAKLNALRIQNGDLAGWISIDNTIIDYPVVHGEDNSYYLTHAFDHTYSVAGTIFLDYRNSNNFQENYNTIIYGHNLSVGTMFSDLDKFFTKSFFNKNKTISVYTESGIYVYEVFNVSKVNVNLDYIRTYFKTPNDFVEFAYEMKAHSIYKTDTQFNSNDRILTLSTCTNAHNSAERYCVQAKLVEVIR